MRLADQLPEPVCNRARTLGAPGLAWLEQLDGVVAELAGLWRFEIETILHGGTESLAAIVRISGGDTAVLKVALPSSSEAAARVLIAANGNGYARVLDHDEGRRALLLERLGAQLHSFNLPVARQIEVICETLNETWRVAPPDFPFMDGVSKAVSLSGYIDAQWAAFNAPCSARAVEIAKRYCVERAAAHDPAKCVLGHADAHSYNTLAVPGSSHFKFVDPEGLIIEPAYDLGISMREWPEDLLAGDPFALGRERCALLAALTGVGEEPIWQWGFIERVSTGFALLQIGWPDVAKQFFAVADAWAEAS